MTLAAARIEPASGVYLRSSLAPLERFLARPDVTDIYVNQPGEIWVETLGGTVERHEDEALNELSLMRLARQVAALTHQGVSREHPLLAATLPDGARIQIVLPPATRGPMVLAIRRQALVAMTLRDYETANAFELTRCDVKSEPVDSELQTLVSERRFTEALALAVRKRKNILVSGGTSTGKTTFLNALLREIPQKERLVFIEDTPELLSQRSNMVGLLAVRGELGEARVSSNELVSASLRLRPDRIILGELRGAEAFAFLRAVRSGHPGSMTTIHADTPDSAVEQLVMLVLQGEVRLSREDIRHYITQSVDLFVQLSRRGERRCVDAIQMPRCSTLK